MRKYLAFMHIALKEALFYRIKIISSLGVWLLRAIIVCALYSYAYAYVGNGAIRGLSREIALWSLATYFVYLALAYRTIYYDVVKEVKHGDVEVRLNKPYSYPLFMILSRLAKSSPEFVLTAIGMGIFLSFYAPLSHLTITPFWILATILLFLGGLVLGCAFYFLIGLVAFWLEEADPVYWLLDKLVMIFAGSYVPVAFFPPILKYIADYSPFGAMVFIDRIFYPDFLSSWTKLVLVQWIWAIIFVGVTAMVYRSVRRQVFISGG